MKKSGPSNPRSEIHFPWKNFVMGLFNRSAIKYIAGTINSVMKNANINPHMMVSDNGFQKTALSPPKKICGIRSVNNVTKLIVSHKETTMKYCSRILRLKNGSFIEYKK